MNSRSGSTRWLHAPRPQLRTGAARLGSGDLGQRIAVKTGDELEALADQFNAMVPHRDEPITNLMLRCRATGKT
jgi:methyl-accepting chemotaxis protein